jgi:hypothetical protein
MMDETQVKDMIEKLEKQREQLLMNLNATDGALQAYRSILDPSMIKQPAPEPAPPQQ